MKKTLVGLFAGCSLFVAGVSGAAAAPVTVDLRIEGPNHTVFEGPVTTDVRTFKYTNSSETHVCDGTAETGGTSPTPVPVRNGALITAAEQHAFALTGVYFSFGPSFDQVGDENTSFNPDTNAFLGEYLNGQFASLGGCSDPIHNGDRVLYAYGDGSEILLGLAGPATTTPGASVVYTVTDLGTGNPVAGATVGSGTSDAQGHVMVGPLAAGPLTVKATKTGAIRSNAVTTCATNGADGFCGTTKPGDPPQPPPPAVITPPCLLTNGHDGRCGTKDSTPSWPSSTFVANKQTFASGKGPRTLSGVVRDDPSGIKDIRIALSRNNAGRCSRFNGTTTRFVKTSRCGAQYATLFSVGATQSWSYLLPAKLPKGRYVLDIRVTDGAGNVSEGGLRGRDRFIFYVK